MLNKERDERGIERGEEKINLFIEGHSMSSQREIKKRLIIADPKLSY